MTQGPNIEHEMPKAYEPGKVEAKWYRFWLEKGYFKLKMQLGKKGEFERGLSPLSKTLPLMQRIHLPIMERGIKGVRFNKSSRKIGILDKVVSLAW